MLDIRSNFGRRVKELRARSGMSQEKLAYYAGLDRTYISGIERGQRNVSLDNIERIAFALHVSISYLFSNERFTANPAYVQKDFTVPFEERFKYHLDAQSKLFAFRVDGLLTETETTRVISTVLGYCASFPRHELNLLVDHRSMKTADGEPAVYNPELIEKAIAFQQSLKSYCKSVVVLCNSEYMVEQMNHMTAVSGISDKSIHLFGSDREMVGRAFQLCEIHGNELVKAAE